MNSRDVSTLGGSMAKFAGITQDMFSVYVPEKWSSNVHTLTRMRNKDAMVALCTALGDSLGPALEGLARQTSDEFPNISNNKRVEAQWVFWFRDAASRQSLASFLERTPLHEKTIFNIALQDKHAIIAVTLHHGGIWAGLRLACGATVDRRNLMAKLSQSWEREKALSILKALPAGTTVRLGEAERPGNEFDMAALIGLSEGLTDEAGDLAIGFALNPADAVAEGADLVDTLTARLADLLPLYRFAAWTKDNDLIEVSKTLQAQKIQRRRDHALFNAGDKVRFVSGLFSGKMGVVQDIDAKSQVRVRVGKMSVTVVGSDLAATAS
jgi:hypothetical protein